MKYAILAVAVALLVQPVIKVAYEERIRAHHAEQCVSIDYDWQPDLKSKHCILAGYMKMNAVL